MMLWTLLAAFCALNQNVIKAISLGFNQPPDVGLTRALQPRQDAPDVPTNCQSTCNPVNSAISAGCTFEACCTSQFETGYFNCFTCVAQAVNVTDFTLPQQTVDALLEECGERGFAIPKLTFPGQDPNRALTTLPINSQSTLISVSGPSASAGASVTTSISTPGSSLTTNASVTLSSNQPTGQTSLSQVSSATQSIVSGLTPSSSSPSPAQTSSQSSGTSDHTCNPMLAVFSGFLIVYFIILV